MAKDTYIHIRVASDLKEEIKAAAEADGRTVANYIIKACKEMAEKDRRTK